MSGQPDLALGARAPEVALARLPRRRWRARDIPALTGRLALVTGGSQGIGYQIAAALAGAGAEVIATTRSAERGEAAAAAIMRTRPRGRVRWALLDLARLSSVAGLAGQLLDEGRPLHLLINNAAIMAPAERQVTGDGFEAQFQINYLAHFALAARLLPLLRAAGAARVTHVSSIAHHRGRIDFDDLQSARRYTPLASYAQSKLANLLFAREMQRRSEASGWGLTSTAGHPGISRTRLAANSRGDGDLVARLVRWLGPLLIQPASAGALPCLYAATALEAEPMAYYGPAYLFETRGPVARARLAAGAVRDDDARRLWDVSEALAGVSFSRT